MRPDLQRIAVEVQACPAVAGLHAGLDAAIVTTLSEGQLIGVAIAGGYLLIGVVGRYPAGAADIAEQIRAASTKYAHGYRIVVSIEDVHVPDDEPTGTSR